MNKQTVKMMPTPEQLEYEELTKKMRLTTAKLRVAQEGVNVSSLSQQSLDKIMRVFDEMEHIQRDAQQKTSKVQQDANIQNQKINQDTSKKMMDIQKKYQDLIKSLKDSHPQEQVEGQVVQQDVVTQDVVTQDAVVQHVEEVREKTHEEKVSEITDIVLKAMRDSVYNRVDEIMKTVDTRAEITVGKGVSASKEEIEEMADHTKQMTVESAIMGPDERPDDKDIPVITPDMMKKTEEEIAKRRGEYKDIGRIE